MDITQRGLEQQQQQLQTTNNPLIVRLRSKEQLASGQQQYTHVTPQQNIPSGLGGGMGVGTGAQQGGNSQTVPVNQAASPPP